VDAPLEAVEQLDPLRRVELALDRFDERVDLCVGEAPSGWRCCRANQRECHTGSDRSRT
jgi:hypothetical protein